MLIQFWVNLALIPDSFRFQNQNKAKMCPQMLQGHDNDKSRTKYQRTDSCIVSRTRIYDWNSPLEDRIAT